MTPHPKVLEAYEEAGYIPHDLEAKSQEQVAFKMLGKATLKTITFGRHPEEQKWTFVTGVEEDPNRPIKRTISKFHRLEDGHVTYSEHLEGERYDGTDAVTHTRLVGKYQMPKIRIRHNRETGESAPGNITDFTPTFEIPLTGGKFIDPSTGKETTLADLYKMAAKDFVFYAKAFARTYSLRGITLDEFIHRPFEDLVFRGENKKWPEPVAPELSAKKSKPNVA